VAAVSTPKSESPAPKHKAITAQLNSLHNHHKTSINANNQLLGIGVRSGQIRHRNSFQYLSFRTLSSTSKASRIKHSSRLEHQKYITGYTTLLSKSASNQTNGYYLYHLHKLLIWPPPYSPLRETKDNTFLFLPIKWVKARTTYLSGILNQELKK